MPTTIATLRTMALQKADMENSSFVGTDELNRVLQDGYAELYDLLTAKNQDYYLGDPTSFTLTSSNKYALPADFYKVVGVDISENGKWYELDPFNFNERNHSSLRGPYLHRRRRYRVMGTNLHITPDDDYAGSYRIWYYPTCPVLVTVGSLDVHAENWREYIVLTAAIYCLTKEESDSSALELKRQALRKHIEELAASRDVGRSARIQDVRSYNPYDPEY